MKITLIVVLKKLLVNILIAESCDTHNSWATQLLS